MVLLTIFLFLFFALPSDGELVFMNFDLYLVLVQSWKIEFKVIVHLVFRNLTGRIEVASAWAPVLFAVHAKSSKIRSIALCICVSSRNGFLPALHSSIGLFIFWFSLCC